MNSEEEEKIIDMLTCGRSVPQIADNMRYHRATILQHVNRFIEEKRIVQTSLGSKRRSFKRARQGTIQNTVNGGSP